jgi:hypothetical protein
MRTTTPNGGTHGEMTLDGQRIMMGQGSKEWRMVSAHEAHAATQGIFIYLADVDAHYERARAAGAEIVKPPELHRPRPRRASLVLHDASRRALIELCCRRRKDCRVALRPAIRYWGSG